MEKIELPEIRCGNCGYITPMIYAHLHREVECKNCHAIIKLDKKNSEFYKKKVSDIFDSKPKRSKWNYPSISVLVIILGLVIASTLLIVCAINYNRMVYAYDHGEDFTGVLGERVSYETMRTAELKCQEAAVLQSTENRASQLVGSRHSYKTY